MTRRAVITGIGVVAPNGIGTAPYWKATQTGLSGLRRISRFDVSSYSTQVAGEIDGFDARDFIEQRLIVATDRWTHTALAAAQMALEDAAFDPASRDPFDMSVVTASSSGGNEFGQREIQALWYNGPKFVSVFQSIAWFYAASTGQVSIRHGMKGACGVVMSEGAGGLDALSVARRTVRRGGDVVVAGGTEAPVSPYALVCQMANGLLSTSPDPETAYRPFDAQASGYVPGEGGAMMLIEDLEHARSRGVPQIYAEIAGHGATQDAYHHSRPAPDGRQYARAMARAIADAGLQPDDIDVVFADAFGVPSYDAIEATALRQVFGDRAEKVPVTAPKTMVGRLYAGGAALDVATAALGLRDDVLPPTIHVDQLADGCQLNLVREATRGELRQVLVAARGFGGFNSAIVLRKLGD